MVKKLSLIAVGLILVNYALGEEKVYFTSGYGGGNVMRCNTDGSNLEQIVSVAPSATSSDIEIDSIGQKIYWGLFAGEIYQANLDGSGVNCIINDSSYVWGIEIDVIGRRLYWTDPFGGVIRSANLDGSDIKIIIHDIPSPVGLALDVSNGKIYWVEQITSTIQRANLDGSDMEDFISIDTSSGNLGDIQLDLFYNKLYWTECGSHKIGRADLDGSNPEYIVDYPGDAYNLTLDVFDNKIYFATHDGSILKCDLNGHNMQSIVSGLGDGNAWGIALYPKTDEKPYEYSGGSGTEADPYQIATAADLIAMGDNIHHYGKYFKLIKNINMSGNTLFRALIAQDTDPSTSGFQGTPFYGFFDGSGFEITNLTISGEINDFLGFVGYIKTGGQIKNIILENVSIRGKSYIGGICGISEGVIRYCYASGQFIGDGDYVGGLCGYNWNATIYQSSADVYVTGGVINGMYAGGICGWNEKGNIDQCYSSGTVSGTYPVGGLIGGNNGTITQCYSTARVSGIQNLGGLCGHNVDWGIIENSFWDLETSNQSFSAGGTGKTTEEMQDIQTFVAAGWDFSESDGDPADWYMPFNGYPKLSWEPIKQKYSGGSGTEIEPYQIATAEDLVSIGGNIGDYDKYFVLTADIDLSEYTFDRAIIAPDMDNGDHDYNGLPFSGQINGNEHAISNIFIDNNSGTYLGLIGQLGSNGKLMNLKMVDCQIIGRNYLGSLAGRNLGTIEGCGSSGYILGTGDYGYGTGGLVGRNDSVIKSCQAAMAIEGGRNVGGLVGFNEGPNGLIVYCSTEGTVTGNNDNTGGLVGYNCGQIKDSYSLSEIHGLQASGGLVGQNYINSKIEFCYASGNVYGSLSVGGLIGYSECGSIISCFASGNVTGDGSSIGGLIGYSERSNITRCFAEGNVVARENKNAGGLCGRSIGGEILSCYASGEVSGISNVGGLCGENSALITKCYAKANVTGTVDSIGGFCGRHYEGYIFNCYSVGLITGGLSSSIGGFCGSISSGGIDDCYWDIDTSGYSESNGGTGKTTAELKSIDTYLSNGWDFSDIDGDQADWRMPNNDYPKLAWEAIVIKYSGGSGTKVDPYQIATEQDVLTLGQGSGDYDKHFVLMNDIHLSGLDHETALVASDSSSSSGFQGTAFTGSFDGQGHSIIGLTIDGVAEGNDYLGLFGYVGTGGIVKNLQLVDCSVAGDDNISCLAGMVYGSIENCTVQGTLTGDDYIGGITSYKVYGNVRKCWADVSIHTGDYAYYIGGLVGQTVSSTITDCTVQVAITCPKQADWVGGLVGGNTNSQIAQCGSNGTISTNDMCDNLGGLVGINYGGTIKESYSTVDLSCSGDCWFIGGLVGNNTYYSANHRLSSIVDCYAQGNISGRQMLGGLVGSNEYGCQMINCYSTGSVTGSVGGGLAAYNISESGDTCFWDMQSSGMTYSGAGTGLLTETMQDKATFTGAGWDFENIWHMPYQASGYPMLWWQRDIPGDTTGSYGVNMEDYEAISNQWLIPDGADITEIIQLSEYWLAR